MISVEKGCCRANFKRRPSYLYREEIILFLLDFVYHYDILILEVRRMGLTMNKELLIRMPASLYRRAKILCQREYKSLSALVRELLLERLDETLTKSEMASIKKARKAFHAGKGTDWRKIRRG